MIFFFPFSSTQLSLSRWGKKDIGLEVYGTCANETETGGKRFGATNSKIITVWVIGLRLKRERVSRRKIKC